MSIYTVHMPAPTAQQSTPDPDRFVFVRDGFSFWAFVITPVWMLWHRLWLVFAAYVVLVLLLTGGLQLLGASGAVTFTVGVLIALLVGIEAGTLRRLTLARRRFSNVGIVVGEDIETAERRFFDAWLHRVPRGSASTPAPVQVTIPPGSAAFSGGGPGIVGLFPQPGGSR